METKGFAQDFDAVQFMDESARASLPPVPLQASATSGAWLRPPRPEETRVVVTDIDIPFFSMVNFMVKWAFAAIPATIIICVIVMIVMIVISVGLAVFGLK